MLRRKNTCVISLVMFYENITTNKTKVYRELSCVLYYFIYNYVCIDYLIFHYKKLSSICCDKLFASKSYN